MRDIVSPLDGFASPFPRRDAAPFTISLTGLSTDSLGTYAQVGDHAGIGYTIDPDNGTETVKWSNSSDPDPAATYGTGASPTDYTAGDEGTLWLHVTDGGETVSRSVAIRRAPGTLSIANQSAWTVDDTSVNLDASASGASLTFSYAASGLPAGLSINASSGAITGTPTGASSGTATITATDQYGRELTDNFTWSAVLRTQATAANGLSDPDWTVDDDTVNINAASDFTANGNDLTYVITGLPTGLVDDGDGTISGTPTVDGQSGTVTITATDEYDRETVSTFTFTTSYRSQATGGADLDLSFPEDSAISSTDLIQNWTANGNTLSFVSVSPSLPAGLSISSAGALTGTPTTVTADATYTLTMEDEYGRETSDTFTLEITVGAVNPSLSLGSQTAGSGGNPDSIAVSSYSYGGADTVTLYAATANSGTVDDAILAADGTAGASAVETDNQPNYTGQQFDLDGFTDDTVTHLHMVAVEDNNGGTSGVQVVALTDIDFTAPALVIDSVTAGDGELTIAWQTDDGDGTARFVAVLNGASAPSAAQILAGQDSNDSAAPSTSSISVSASGSQSDVAITGLVNGNVYAIYGAQENARGATSTDSDMNNTPTASGGYSALYTDDFTSYGSDQAWTTVADIDELYAIDGSTATIIAADDRVTFAEGHFYDGIAVYYSGAIGADQKAVVELSSQGFSVSSMTVMVRASVGTAGDKNTLNGYGVEYRPDLGTNGVLRLREYNNGTGTAIGSDYDLPNGYFDGQRIEIEVTSSGNDAVVKVHAELTDGGGVTNDVITHTFTSAAHTSGAPALRYYASSTSSARHIHVEYAEFGEFT